MRHMLPLFAAILTAMLSTTAYADFFLNESDYNSAVGTITRPDYDSFGEIDFPLGDTDFFGIFDVTSAGDPSTSANAAEFNGVKNFVFDFDPNGLSSVTFRLPEPVKGVSAIFSNTFVQDGFRVSTPLNDYDLNVLVSSLDATFVGITEDELFDTVTFSTTDNIPGNDFVFFREFAFAAAVPEPGSIGLIMLSGIALLTKRRRA